MGEVDHGEDHRISSFIRKIMSGIANGFQWRESEPWRLMNPDEVVSPTV
jgi:hypothetical protein